MFAAAPPIRVRNHAQLCAGEVSDAFAPWRHRIRSSLRLPAGPRPGGWGPLASLRAQDVWDATSRRVTYPTLPGLLLAGWPVRYRVGRAATAAMGIIGSALCLQGEADAGDAGSAYAVQVSVFGRGRPGCGGPAKPLLERSEPAETPFPLTAGCSPGMCQASTPTTNATLTSRVWRLSPAPGSFTGRSAASTAPARQGSGSGVPLGTCRSLPWESLLQQISTTPLHRRRSSSRAGHRCATTCFR